MPALHNGSPRWLSDNIVATLRRHCERSEAIQSSVPQAGTSKKWLDGARCSRADCGAEDWIASLRSQ
jgi:hypothetical protein